MTRACSFFGKRSQHLFWKCVSGTSVKGRPWLAQEILSQGLEERKRLEALCNGLSRAITPSVKEAIESQGYTADIVLDDFMNFDMRKSLKEITEKQAR